MAISDKGIADDDTRIIKVQGPVSSGKTRLLIERVAHLVSSGVAPSDILVETSSAIAAQTFSARLAEAAGDDARAVRVTTPKDIVVEILSTPEARDQTGRVPRLVNGVEWKFVLEDLKTCGMKRRKLRGMLGLFFDKWAEGSETGRWLERGEMEDLYRMLLGKLGRLESMLPEEAAFVCAGFLRSDAGAQVRGSIPYVLCDDYQNMSHTEQEVLCSLASTQLVVAGNVDQCVAVRNARPCAQGFADFEKLRHNVEVVELTASYGNPAVQRFASRLAEHSAAADGHSNATDPADGRSNATNYVPGEAAAPADDATGTAATPADGVAGAATAPASEDSVAAPADIATAAAAAPADGGSGAAATPADIATAAADDITGSPAGASGVIAVKWATPEEEFNGVTKFIRHVVDLERDTSARGTYVVVPNRRWARTTASVLKQRGFDVSTAAAGMQVSGDPRDESKSRSIRAYTLLNLLAHPKDVMAWRCWCGIGNYLTNSDAWLSLEHYADEKGIGLYDALEAASAEDKPPFQRAEALTVPFLEGKRLIKRYTGRRGFGLIAAIGGESLPEFKNVADQLVGDEGANVVFDLLERSVADPLLPEENDRELCIVTLPNLCGLRVENLFVIGAIDGFIPRRDAFEVVSTDEERARVLDDDRRAFYSGVGKAQSLLVVSMFSKADLELAERSKMQVARVRSEHGKRIAQVRPSRFLEEARDAYPGTVGGQQLLSEYGINNLSRRTGRLWV
jgi:hypothetical protein